MPTMIELMSSGAIPALGGTINTPSFAGPRGVKKYLKTPDFQARKMWVRKQLGVPVPSKRDLNRWRVGESTYSLVEMQFYFDTKVASGYTFDDALSRVQEKFGRLDISVDILGRLFTP